MLQTGVMFMITFCRTHHSYHLLFQLEAAKMRFYKYLVCQTLYWIFVSFKIVSLRIKYKQFHQSFDDMFISYNKNILSYTVTWLGTVLGYMNDFSRKKGLVSMLGFITM